MPTIITFRRATRDDLDIIVSMLADDHLGQQRERYTQPLPAAYEGAFQAIDADSNQELIVACADAQVVGVMQLTYIPYLTYQGGWRALIEGVRIHRSHRSQGVGRQMFEWAIGRARDKGCHLLQLTTDKSRPRAKSFYEDLGFIASHEGMKLHLKATP